MSIDLVKQNLLNNCLSKKEVDDRIIFKKGFSTFI